MILFNDASMQTENRDLQPARLLGLASILPVDSPRSQRLYSYLLNKYFKLS